MLVALQDMPEIDKENVFNIEKAQSLFQGTFYIEKAQNLSELTGNWQI